MNPINKEQIKIIHILKAQRGLDDELYRMNLKAWYNVESSKELTREQADAYIKSLGGAYYKRKKRPGKITDKQRWTIKALWDQVSRTKEGVKREIALNKLVEKLTGISMLEWLTPQKASVMIIALNKMAKHNAASKAEALPLEESKLFSRRSREAQASSRNREVEESERGSQETKVSCRKAALPLEESK